MPSNPPDDMTTTVSPATATERAQGLAHRRRVMGEVVDHGDALGDAAHLLAPAHAAEAAHAAADLVDGEPERVRGGDHRQRVGQVVAAGQPGVEDAERLL